MDPYWQESTGDSRANQGDPSYLNPLETNSGSLPLDCLSNHEATLMARYQEKINSSFVQDLPTSMIDLLSQQTSDLVATTTIENFRELEVQNYTNSFNIAQLVSSSSSSRSTANNSTENIFQLEALSERWQWYLVILYSLTAITSFVLNVITVIVLSRSRSCVLKSYLINLSIGDLLMSLFSIPFTYTEYMLGRWIFPSFLCPVVRFVVTLSVFVSAATMTVIGMNRHLAIMYPLGKKKGFKFCQLRVRKIHVIIFIWLVGIAISTPEYLMFSVNPFCYNKKLYFDCHQVWPESISNKYTIFIYLCTFAIPLSLLSYLYSSIGLMLWRQRTPGNVDVNRDLTMQTNRVKAIKMLFVVVIMFAVSWLPLQTFSMILFLYPEIREDFEYQSWAYNIFICTYFACHWLSMAHSCLNPLIYCFMNDKFRTDLHDLICRRDNYFSNGQLARSQNNKNTSHSSGSSNKVIVGIGVSGELKSTLSNRVSKSCQERKAQSNCYKSGPRGHLKDSSRVKSCNGNKDAPRVLEMSPEPGEDDCCESIKELQFEVVPIFKKVQQQWPDLQRYAVCRDKSVILFNRQQDIKEEESVDSDSRLNNIANL